MYVFFSLFVVLLSLHLVFLLILSHYSFSMFLLFLLKYSFFILFVHHILLLFITIIILIRLAIIFFVSFFCSSLSHKNKKRIKRMHAAKRKSRISRGECVPRHHLFLRSHGVPGTGNPEKAENATSFCGRVTEPHQRALFAVLFSSSFFISHYVSSGFVRFQGKNGVQIGTRQLSAPAEPAKSLEKTKKTPKQPRKLLARN